MNVKGDIKKIYESILAIGIGGEAVFLAEPHEVGYKRRKGLADITRENDLPKVLENFLDARKPESLRYGFTTSLKNILKRDTMRLDPKYRWLWDKLNGCVKIADGEDFHGLWSYISIVDLPKLKKGELDIPRKLIDLDSVYGRCNGLVEGSINEVDEIGSDKVIFKGADIIISKLEPYLGKCVVNPDPKAIGTTEWVGFRCKEVNPRVIGYLLALPEMGEAMRMLQSGKRHARLNPKELLELKFNKKSKI